MKVILRGTLAEGASQQEFELAIEGSTTREDLLAKVSVQAPRLDRYLRAGAQAGKPVAIMVVADGNWVHPGDPVSATAEVEICPPISGG
jgi:molybdopterin converting factor small subunit